MVYAVPPSKKSIAQNQFQFTLPSTGDKVHSVPLLKFVKPSFMRDFEDLPESQFLIKFLDEQLPGVLDGVDDLEQLEGLFEAWRLESGITVGESDSSPEQSQNTGEQSATSS